MAWQGLDGGSNDGGGGDGGGGDGASYLSIVRDGAPKPLISPLSEERSVSKDCPCRVLTAALATLSSAVVIVAVTVEPEVARLMSPLSMPTPSNVARLAPYAALSKELKSPPMMVAKRIVCLYAPPGLAGAGEGGGGEGGGGEGGGGEGRVNAGDVPRRCGQKAGVGEAAASEP